MANSIETLGIVGKSLLSRLKNAPEGRQATFQLPDIEDDRILLSIRYWGDWIIPEYEDDDYDNEELSDKSLLKLQNIIKEFKEDYSNVSNVSIDFSASEKHWIDIEIT